MSPTDDELLERWRRGDAKSGEALFERYYGMMERFFLNKVPNAMPDLMQETFLRCVKNHRNIRDNKQFRLYIFGIAYNVLNEHLRERYRGGEQLDIHEMSVRAVEPGPVTLVVQHHEHRVLFAALRELAVEDQTILELHYWESLTTEEIAEALDIPLGTARGRLQRARERLAVRIQHLSSSSQDLTTTVASLEDWARGCREQLDRYSSS